MTDEDQLTTSKTEADDEENATFEDLVDVHADVLDPNASDSMGSRESEKKLNWEDHAILQCFTAALESHEGRGRGDWHPPVAPGGAEETRQQMVDFLQSWQPAQLQLPSWAANPFFVEYQEEMAANAPSDHGEGKE